MTWNANSIKFKLNELKFVLCHYNIDVIGISETKLDCKQTLIIPGYFVYRQDRNSQGGGVAVIVRKTIQHNFLPIMNLEFFEAVGIKLKVGQAFINVIQAYIPPKNKIVKSDLNKIFHNNNNVILMGDFNAKHRAWNCFCSNAKGKIILNYCTSAHIDLNTPEVPTHFSKIGKPSIIDFFIIKNVKNVNKSVTLPILNSDHNPVLLQLTEKPILVTNIIYDYKNANWENFRAEINQNTMLNFHLKSRQDIEKKVIEFQNIIKSAANNSIPTVNFSQLQPTLPDSIKFLIQIKNKLRSKWQKYRNPLYHQLYAELQKIVNSKIREFNNENISRLFLRCKISDNSLWRLTKKYGKKENYIPPLQVGNKICYETEEKVAELAKYFKTVHEQNADLGNKTHDKNVKNSVNKFLRVNNHKIQSVEHLATPREIAKYIKKLKNNKAPGFDLITGMILKKLPRKAIVLLTKIVNSMLSIGHFPSVWKFSKLIPIYKNGKDSKLVSSYRPISLLSQLSKIAERVIVNRFNKFVNEKKLLADEQFGFRVGHSTTDQLMRVVNLITSNFNKKLHTGVLLLDVEKAFDTVWIYGLIYKMLISKFPTYLIIIIFSYMSNRKFFVSVCNILSQGQMIVAGVPQGSVMGPILYNFYINDAPKTDKVDEGIFADDKAFITSSYRLSAIVSRLNQAATKIYKFYNKWKIKINVLKTEAIVFTKRRPALNLNVCFNSHNIEWSDSVKYLGLLLDAKLTFTKHTKYAADKALKLLLKYYPLLNKNSKLSTKNKLNIYKVIVRPAMLYASPVWSLISKTNFGTLQVQQNKFLRLAGNYRKFTKISCMHKDLEIDTVFDYVRNATAKYFSKISTHDNIHIRNLTTIKGRHRSVNNIIN